MFRLIVKKIVTILRSLNFLIWIYASAQCDQNLGCLSEDALDPSVASLRAHSKDFSLGDAQAELNPHYGDQTCFSMH